MTDPSLERWRLVLGEPGSACTGGAALSPQAAARDAALEWLYDRDGDLDRRDVRRGAGQGGSTLTTVDWLDDVHRLFPRTTVERLQRDAVERFGLVEVVTDPDLLERVAPSPALLAAVLRTKHLMDPRVLRLARELVARVVCELVARLAVEVRHSFSGPRSRRPSTLARASSLDLPRTVRANLKHWDPERRRLLVERPLFAARTRRHLDPWQLVLLVDQSGSMTGSVIHSAVTAACLWSLPGLRTHLVAFDTEVVDLTRDVDDPVELLMKVQLGGGTDIARAVRYGASLLEQPLRSIVVLVTDLYEGGDAGALVRTVRGLVEQGSRVLVLGALDEQAHPDFDRALGQRLADVGAHVGAMTPGELVTFVADALG